MWCLQRNTEPSFVEVPFKNAYLGQDKILAPIMAVLAKSRRNLTSQLSDIAAQLQDQNIVTS
jgi:hypothetical protein